MAICGIFWGCRTLVSYEMDGYVRLNLDLLGIKASRAKGDLNDN